MKKESVTLDDGSIIILPVVENYRDCLKLVESDFFRLNGRLVSPISIILKLLFNPFKYPMAWFRLCKHHGLFHPIFIRLYKLCALVRNIDIPTGTRIGFGLYIGHGMNIVINGGTIIGNNVNISQFLNIGTNHNSPAIIGDECYIGPMVCIIEDVQIGNGSCIRAGAVVTHNIPRQCVAVGVPAKVIRNKNTLNINRFLFDFYL